MANHPRLLNSETIAKLDKAKGIKKQKEERKKRRKKNKEARLKREKEERESRKKRPNIEYVPQGGQTGYHIKHKHT